MSDQRMNAGDQGSQPDSGSDPKDQVTVDGQGAARGRPGKGAHPDPLAADREATDPRSQGDVTEAAHRKGQKKG
jgi:hypothetical protein